MEALIPEHVFRSGSVEETRTLGARLGRLLEPGDFVGLEGPLGVGKTVFARGVAEGAEVSPDEIASPSFAIVYPYQGRIPIFHADLYRIADGRELYATGFFDLGASGALLVEWVDRVWDAAPEDWLRVRFRDAGESARELAVRAAGPRSSALLRGWALRAKDP